MKKIVIEGEDVLDLFELSISIFLISFIIIRWDHYVFDSMYVTPKDLGGCKMPQ